MGGIKNTENWQRLKSHQEATKSKTLREYFAEDSERAAWFSQAAGDWFLDYSKNLIDKETMELLIALAREQGVESNRDNMFAGEKINSTEGRAALHVALRNPAESHVTVDGHDVMPDVKLVLGKMGAFVEAIHSGNWLGATGKPIKNIVNIGIGGSHLGPQMVCEALRAYSKPELNVRYVSNVDDADFQENVVADLDPSETLFVVVSKTFTTDETMTNALSARIWLTDKLGDEAIDKHFVAVSTNEEKVRSFGIDPSNMFAFWDWVGGRFSLSSAAGLSVMLAIGSQRFNAFLHGMHTMDEHFRSAPLEENMPVLMAMISVWYSNFYETQTELMAPYSNYLKYLPSYVQQLSMESNGKRKTKDGQAVEAPTAPVVWGQPGTNAQHSYFQLLHQGTHLVPADFIGFIESNHSLGEHHRKLMANMLAQSEALAFGKTIEELRSEGVDEHLLAHKEMPGNRPSNTLLTNKLTPETLGQLVALYEHKTFVQGVVWGVNSFDQWGVELGKSLAQKISAELRDAKIEPDHDGSTNSLIDRAR